MHLARLNLFAGMLVLLFFVSSVGGCGGNSGGQGGQQETDGSTLTVLAASSLTDAFGELERRFEERNPNVDVQTSFASSSELLAQIRQGAPADVFASADGAKMDAALKEGLVREPKIFARNRPVVIVSTDNPAGIQEFRDLAGAYARMVLAEDGVPIAEYAKEVLANADAAYGGNFEQRVFDKIVSREANVRASANRVALGEADATFVYQSDVATDIRNRVQVIQIPENLNMLATYHIATIEQSQNPELAQRWVDLVLSDEGQGVLEGHGFERAG
ncbi:MAG TPA: molybdate ABC transporter substrate-binding protein [Rubrobacteraceae bacterium]|nr:molybdate ABC transporter substrate-binding protein [Rubrobacteraceae bacterium]